MAAMLATFTRFALALVLVAAASPGVRADAPAGDAAAVYARMQQVNSGLESYQADLHVDITTHGFPFISPSLDGKAYFERPDKNAVVFETMPALASAFKKVYPQLEPPSEWPRIYDVTPISDDGTTSEFRLVRKKNGRIDHVEVTVDDRTATIRSMAYIYKDGGTISFQQTYAVVDGNYVIKSQTGRVDIPHYSADVASTFSNYQLNVKIDQGVFATD
jgi:outer membrane lipoprotein-sorting protein